MDPTKLQILMAAGASLLGGAGVGWWLRGRYNWSRSVMMDELWTRKIRSYEQATEEALQARTRDQTARSSAEETLGEELQRYAALQLQTDGLNQENERLREVLVTHRSRIEKIELYAVELDGKLKTARQRLTEDAAKIADQQKRLKRLRAYPPRLEECEAELTRLETRTAETNEEREAEIVRLSDWIAELTPLTETLRRRDEEFAGQSRSFVEDRGRYESRLASQESRLSESQAQLQQLMESRASLEADLAVQRERAGQLEQLQEQLQASQAQHEAQRQEAIGLALKVTELQVRLGATKREAEAHERGVKEQKRLLIQEREAQQAKLEAEKIAKAGREAKAKAEQEAKAEREAQAKKKAEAEATKAKARRKPKAAPRKSAKPAATGSPSSKNAGTTGVLFPRGSAKKTAQGKQVPAATTPSRSGGLAQPKKPAQKAAAVAVKGTPSAKQPTAKKTSTQKSTAAKKVPAKAKSARPKKKSSSSSAISVARDDFSRIKGIGPKVVERLAAADIRTFAQLASLGKQNLEHLSQDLGVPAKRIQREDWLKHATQLSQSGKK